MLCDDDDDDDCGGNIVSHYTQWKTLDLHMSLKFKGIQPRFRFCAAVENDTNTQR